MRPLEFQCTITQGVGDTYNGFKHVGVDEACGYGSDVLSYVNGYVYSIYTPEKPAKDGYTAVYALCKTPLENFEFTVGHFSVIHTEVGDAIKEGELLGQEGNSGLVYSRGELITSAMKRAGSRLGSHRHTQKRPVLRVKETQKNEMYLRTAGGLYRDSLGYFYEVYNFNNGLRGCVDFTKPLWQRDLRYIPLMGSSGYDVLLLQRALVLQGQADFEPTGYFGAQTKSALAEYQRQAGITPTSGYFGRITRTHLNAVYKQLT